MTAEYENKIIEAFRDNAIRSVLLIDDEYITYERLIDQQKEFIDKIIFDANNNESIGKEYIIDRLSILNISNNYYHNAKKFVEFFHNKKLICDVESQTDNLDHEKIRKSDLILLDYHLQDNDENNNPAERSLNLINDLSHSKHMNIVVLYTRENLSNVWLEVAATLRGSKTTDYKSFFSSNELIDDWESNEAEWIQLWDNTIGSNQHDSDYITSSIDIKKIINEFEELHQNDDMDFDIPKPEHIEFLLEISTAKKNKNNIQHSKLDIYGKDQLWLQAGDIFVVLCEKVILSDDGSYIDTTPEYLWNRIEAALIDWYPSFYRVITSELQNQIEDANLSMEKLLSKGEAEQVASLWGILRVDADYRQSSAKEMLSNILFDISDLIQNSSDFLSFIVNTANSTSDNIPSYISLSKDKQKHNQYIKEIVDISANNYSKSNINISPEYYPIIAHAFNEQLCSTKEVLDYVTTGMIFKHEMPEKTNYYLCIAPSCNTIPGQLTGMIAQDMTPHRPMRFIRLQKTNLKKSLISANKSNVIFISDDGDRLALSIHEGKLTDPTIEQGVVVNHDDIRIECDDTKPIQFIYTCSETKELKIETREFKPIARLRPSFASRYQNTQLQYEARIGVDFVSADMR